MLIVALVSVCCYTDWWGIAFWIKFVTVLWHLSLKKPNFQVRYPLNWTWTVFKFSYLKNKCIPNQLWNLNTQIYFQIKTIQRLDSFYLFKYKIINSLFVFTSISLKMIATSNIIEATKPFVSFNYAKHEYFSNVIIQLVYRIPDFILKQRFSGLNVLSVRHPP